MAIIDLEFTDDTFGQLLWALVAGNPAVPFPTLESLGPDRLIAAVGWPSAPVLEVSPPVPVRPGELVFRLDLSLRHVSVAELLAVPTTPGVSESGHAWFRVASSSAGMRIDLVAYALTSGTVQVMTHPQSFGLVALPGLPVPVFATAVVRDGTSTALRLATAQGENLLAGPGGFLAARNAAGESSGNWGLHVPAGVFLELVGGQLGDAVADLDADTEVEDALSTSWGVQEDGAWGVSASVGLLKRDACPGLFGSVDISVGLNANASFTVGTEPTNHLDVRLVTATNASDWDAFRCWLGNGAVIGGLAALINPFLGLGVGVGSLIAVGEVIRAGGVRPLHKKASVGPLTKVSDTSDGAIYTQTIELPTDAVPGTGEELLEIGAGGLDLVGTATLPPLSHRVSFAPDGGALVGVDYSSRIDCSHRAIAWTFTFAPLTITDRLGVGIIPIDPPLPVFAFPSTTSNVLGTGAGLVEVSGSTFRVRGGALRPGQSAWLVLHTSAGVRLYTLGPVPERRDVIGTDRLIDLFCDTIHELVPVVSVDELKFVAPEPQFEYGFEALQQWQVVLGGLRDGAEVVVSSDGRDLLSSADLDVRDGRAVGQVLTERGSSVALRTDGERFGLAAAHRWLVPFRELDLPTRARGLTLDGRDVVVQTDGGAFRVDPVTYALTRAPEDRGAVEPALPLGPSVVAAVHDGRVLLAFPTQTQTSDVRQG